MIVYTYRNESVSIEDEPFSSGGEGEVRRVVSCPSRFSNVCAKLYFKPKQTEEQERKIRFMVENPPSDFVGTSMMLAWPLETLYSSDGNFMGFLMPTAFPDSKKLTILILPRIKKSLKTEWYKFDKEYNIKYALVSRMKLINNIAIPIHILHATNKYILKDFKPDNVLVTPTGKVTIVDMDSIQICDKGKLLFPGTAATDNYIPPECYKGVGQNKTDILKTSWDNFAVSVVFYQLLFGIHPYWVATYEDTEESHTVPYCIRENLFPFGPNASKIKSYSEPHKNFKIVPPQVQQLFIRAFGLSPEDRPQAMEWGKTIKQVVESSGNIEITPPSVLYPNTATTPTPKVTSNSSSSAAVEYNLSVETPSYGKASLSVFRAKPGKVVYVAENPKRGYMLSEISYISSLGETKLGLKHNFVMPDSDVKVKVVFVKKESLIKRNMKAMFQRKEGNGSDGQAVEGSGKKQLSFSSIWAFLSRKKTKAWIGLIVLCYFGLMFLLSSGELGWGGFIPGMLCLGVAFYLYKKKWKDVLKKKKKE